MTNSSLITSGGRDMGAKQGRAKRSANTTIPGLRGLPVTVQLAGHALVTLLQMGKSAGLDLEEIAMRHQPKSRQRKRQVCGTVSKPIHPG